MRDKRGQSVSLWPWHYSHEKAMMLSFHGNGGKFVCRGRVKIVILSQNFGVKEGFACETLSIFLLVIVEPSLYHC